MKIIQIGLYIMIILNVFFKVDPMKKADFLQVLHNMVTESNKEEACLRYQLWNNDADPCHYALIEAWKNKEGLEEHQKTAHWIAFNDVVNSFLTENYDENHYQEIIS